MKNKIIAIILLLIMCLIFLVSCGEKPSDNKYTSYNDNGEIGNRLLYLYNHNGEISIYVDKETRVQYMIIRGMECCAIEIMVDAQGNPLLYYGNLEVTENE